MLQRNPFFCRSWAGLRVTNLRSHNLLRTINRTFYGRSARIKRWLGGFALMQHEMMQQNANPVLMHVSVMKWHVIWCVGGNVVKDLLRLTRAALQQGHANLVCWSHSIFSQDGRLKTSWMMVTSCVCLFPGCEFRCTLRTKSTAY